jgi:hypothetical protein
MILSVPPHVEPRRVSVDAIEHWMIYREHPRGGGHPPCARLDGRCPLDRVQLPLRHLRAGKAVADIVRRASRPFPGGGGLKNHGLTITGPSLDEIFDRIEGTILSTCPMSCSRTVRTVGRTRHSGAIARARPERFSGAGPSFLHVPLGLRPRARGYLPEQPEARWRNSTSAADRRSPHPSWTLTKKGARTRATTLMSLTRMFSEGPEVSLNGSPTVSPRRRPCARRTPSRRTPPPR